VLAEDALDRDHFGLVSLDPGADVLLQDEQPLRDLVIGGRANHAERDRGQLTARRAFHHTKPAPGEPWVDPKHAQRNLRIERTFEA
jgi:hypothetical protein